ncbi:hypothetical protein [Hydrogenophaga sp. BPS33]|uniref:hypothetical protein n=1 Tax=Hydrogenophaga sp. BPS33 TaxID=2651974 RepID=UPI0013203979|nr:hypothetical protein [Hydrogenophaga sp. BPS33]QHE85888.1 helix-turn-helix domain-containing protein [Hydrogenophaga sp. BPS33]
MNNQIQSTAQVLLGAAREQGLWLSGDLRVGLRDAAGLIGMGEGSLRNLITQGKGPATYKLGGGGHQRTVRIIDLATWLESRRGH